MGADYGSGFAEPRERVQIELVSAHPTGPVTVASARNRRVRRFGCAAARLRRRRGGRILQRLGRSGGPSERLWRGRARGGAAGGWYRGAYVTISLGGDPVPAILEQIEATLRVPHPSIPGRTGDLQARAGLPRCSIPREGRERARGDLLATRRSCYRRSGDRCRYRAAVSSPRGRSSKAASTAICVLSAPARHTWRYAAVTRMLGFDPEREGALHLLASSRHTQKKCRRRGDVVFLDGSWTGRGSDATVVREPQPDQTIGIDVDLAASRGKGTSLRAVRARARIRRDLRARAARRDRRCPARAGGGGERADLAPLRLPATAREAARRRGPLCRPAYAIRPPTTSTASTTGAASSGTTPGVPALPKGATQSMISAPRSGRRCGAR
jgi:hypothetical protein